MRASRERERTTPASVRRALASLRELDSLDPVAIRERVVRVVVDVGEGDGGSFWSLGQTARSVVPMRLHGMGVSNPEDYWEGLRNIDFTNPVVDPRRPRHGSANRFVPGIASGWVRELSTTPYYESVWRIIRLHDQLRAFLYHGGQFIGALSAGRMDGSPAFSDRDVKRARTVIAAAQGALLSAQAAEIEGEAADLIVRPDGRIELASATATGWLAVPGFRDRVSAVVRSLEQGHLEGLENLALASVRWSRLHGVGGHCYLLHLAPAPPVQIATDAALSPAQRRTAEFLAAGATVREAAVAMGIGPETVRTHLREAYRRLGVASRVELSRVLSG